MPDRDGGSARNLEVRALQHRLQGRVAIAPRGVIEIAALRALRGTLATD
jgi:hypothetical protein